jgi:hypothetical protein
MALGMLLLGLISTGCTLTPHANVGVDFYMSDGKLKARPNANVGVWGTP